MSAIMQSAPSFVTWGPITLVCVLFVLAMPLTVIAFYVLRLGVRRTALLDKVTELKLEAEYLRLYDYEAYCKALGAGREAELRDGFRNAFTKKFRGDNLFLAYVPPLLLMLLTTAVFVGVLIVLWINKQDGAELLNHAAVFAMAGALVYAYPLLIRRYAALSLNPQSVYEIVGSLWLSAFIGLVVSNLAADTLKPAAAFVGSILPIPAFAWVRKRVLSDKSTEEQAEEAAKAELMEIVDQDRDLLDELSYIGVRSVAALAFENPLRLFVETDPNLVHCIDLVDRANLWLLVPEQDLRANLNRLAIRSAVDLMTQIYEDLPMADGTTAYRYLRPDEPCPQHLMEPLQGIATAMRVTDIASVRNLMTMMSENPQMLYLQNLWGRMSDSIDEADEAQRVLIRRVSPMAAPTPQRPVHSPTPGAAGVGIPIAPQPGDAPMLQ